MAEHRIAGLYADIYAKDMLTPVVNSINGRMAALTASMRRFSVLALGGLGLASVTGIFKKTIGAASDLNEAVNKVETIFGDASSSVINFADYMTRAFGVSKQEALDGAGNFGLMLRATGSMADEAARTSIQLTKLAADASSLYNIPLAQAMEKIRAGMAGMAVPGRTIGVMLSANAVKEEALRLGLVQGKEKLSEYAKTTARVSIITRGLGLAQGDLAKTINAPANQMRMFSSNVTNLGAAIGKSLLPAFGVLIKSSNSALIGMNSSFNQNQGGVKFWADTIVSWLLKIPNFFRPLLAALGDFLRTANAAFGQVTGIATFGDKVTVARGGLTLFRDAIISVLNTAAKALPPIAGFLAPIYAWTADRLPKAFSFLGLVIGKLWGWFSLAYDAASKALPGIIAYLQPIGAYILTNIGPAIRAVGQWFQSAYRDAVAAIAPIIDALKPIGETISRDILPTLAKLISPLGIIKAAAIAAFGFLVPLISPIAAVIMSLVSPIGIVAAAFLGFGGSVQGMIAGVQGLMTWISPLVNSLVGLGATLFNSIFAMGEWFRTTQEGQSITGAFGTALQFLGSIFTWFRDLAISVIDAVSFTIRNWGDIIELTTVIWTTKLGQIVDTISWMRDVASAAVDWLMGNWKTIITDTIGGIIQIMRNMAETVGSIMREIWDYITSFGKDPIEIKIKPVMEGIQGKTPQFEMPTREVRGEDPRRAEIENRIATSELQRQQEKAAGGARMAAGMTPTPTDLGGTGARAAGAEIADEVQQAFDAIWGEGAYTREQEAAKIRDLGGGYQMPPTGATTSMGPEGLGAPPDQGKGKNESQSIGLADYATKILEGAIGGKDKQLQAQEEGNKSLKEMITYLAQMARDTSRGGRAVAAGD